MDSRVLRFLNSKAQLVGSHVGEAFRYDKVPTNSLSLYSHSLENSHQAPCLLALTGECGSTSRWEPWVILLRRVQGVGFGHWVNFTRPFRNRRGT